jgi:hypothetical protein
VTDEAMSPPDDLGPAGRELWLAVVDEFTPARYEVRALYETARECDLIDKLADAVESDGLMVEGSKGQPVLNPAVSELRQHRLAFVRMAEALNLSAENAPPETERTKRARHAANARWSRQRDLDAQRAELRSVPS